MKFLKFYNETLRCNNEDEVFDYFLNNLKVSNRSWSYFVNWEKVFTNTKKIEIALNNLNYLIGKKNFDKEFKFLIKQNPEIIKIIPALVVRDGENTNEFKILVDYKNKKLIYEDYDFSKSSTSDRDIEKYLTFVKETGLKHLITSQKIKNLVDYMIGVEAGLDSNGRKNRGGHSMEKIVDFFIADICQQKGFNYLKEANAKKIKKEWGFDVPVDKSSRRYDFVVNTGDDIIIFETNFYGSTGSKIDKTASDYRNLFDSLKNKNYKFVWITDGKGWLSTALPLRETFNHNDYIFSLDMIEKGILSEVVKK